MEDRFFEWANFGFGVVGNLIALAAVVVGIIALRSPTVRKKLGINVKNSRNVKLAATDETEANIQVEKSSDVDISVGNKTSSND